MVCDDTLPIMAHADSGSRPQFLAGAAGPRNGMKEFDSANLPRLGLDSDRPVCTDTGRSIHAVIVVLPRTRLAISITQIAQNRTENGPWRVPRLGR